MLLGFRFAPRLSDLSDQTLYRPRKHTDYSVLTPVLKKDIREDLIVRHWDDIKPIRRFLMRVHPIKRIVLVVLPVIAALSLALFFSAHASPSASARALHPQKPLSGCCAIIYTHIATASNTTANWTELDNNDTNNNPKAFVIVTPNRSASPGHVVMYLGSGQVIQAPRTGENVQIDPVDLATIVVATRPADLAAGP